MKALALAGVVVLILGIVSFFVPMPHSEHHGVNVGDAHIGVTTEHDEKVPPALSIVLVVVGAGLMIAGRKSSRSVTDRNRYSSASRNLHPILSSVCS